MSGNPTATATALQSSAVTPNARMSVPFVVLKMPFPVGRPDQMKKVIMNDAQIRRGRGTVIEKKKLDPTPLSQLRVSQQMSQVMFDSKNFDPPNRNFDVNKQ